MTSVKPNERPVIQQLNQTLINQIAAGEVIERPAAALKELVENSIDAKATQIDVVLRDGGKSLIQVTDDGVGLTESDLLIAMQRHATSKLPTCDLFHINTLGFRGEALPSIGSVSRLSIVSFPKHSEQNKAMELCVEGGEMSPPRPASYPKHGTRITVKDLFYATPARLKFLKSDTVENTACLDMIKRLALCHPSVAFRCQVEDKVVLNYQRCDSLSERCAEILTQKTLENLRIIESERDGLHVHGMISLPTFHKSQATEQFFFVNNRPVRDRLFLGCLKAAYQDYIERGRHPVVALFVTIDPSEVDVNVHPTKAEVRFRPEQALRSLLIGAIKSTLNAHGREAAMALTSNTMMRFQAAPADVQPTLLDYAASHARQNVHDFKTQSGSPASFSNRTLPFSQKATYTSGYGASYSSVMPQFRKTSFSGSLIDNDPLVDFPATNLRNPNLGNPDDLQQNPALMSHDDFGFMGHAKAQIANSYIVAETHEGLMLVDQHAAHERVRYEQLKLQFLAGGVARQLLLIPHMVAISEQQCESLKMHKDSLKQFGFDVDVFANEAVFRSIPSLLVRTDCTSMIDDVISDVCHDTGTLNIEDALLTYLATHACHTSIRAGDALSFAEMNALLRAIEETPNSAMCNHGRPTFIKLTLADIETLFSRR